MVSEIRGPIGEEGFLIRSVDYGDSHRILNFFTKGKGRIDLIALGAKKSKKRFSGLLDYFNQLQLLYRENPRGSLGRLEEVTLKKTFPGIRQDYEKSMVGLEWVRLLREVVPEGARIPQLYDLFDLALRHLERENAAWADVLFRRRAL
ncbi:MAG: DNA repair protein RecO, partial [bacterium]|nr:DNA repair protein RecO [bacterium]